MGAMDDIPVVRNLGKPATYFYLFYDLNYSTYAINPNSGRIRGVGVVYCKRDHAITNKLRDGSIQFLIGNNGNLSSTTSPASVWDYSL